MAFIAERCAVASTSDWPPDRKAMPGTAPGTQRLSTLIVRSATSSTLFCKPATPLGVAIGGAAGRRFSARIAFEAGTPSRRFNQRYQRCAVLGLLADGLVEQDHAGNMLAHGLVGAEQHFAIIAAIVLGIGDADRVKAFLDGAGGFVGGQDAFARRHHLARNFVQLF